MLCAGRLVATGVPEAVLTPQLMAEVYGLEAELHVTTKGQRVVIPVAALPAAPSEGIGWSRV